MTQYAKRSLPAGRIALLIAALALAVVIIISVSRERGPAGDTVSQAEQGTPSIEALERKTRADPGDGEAWGRLGLAYYDDGRFQDAVSAYERASEIDPQQPLIWSALGEALVMASKGEPMPEEAASAFERAVSLDPQDPRARYFLAVRKDLDGDHEGAIADWLALLEDTPIGAPWRGDLVRTIEQVGKINAIDVAERITQAGSRSPAAQPAPMAAGTLPGPSAQDLAAASRMRPSEQRQMAEGMVERLELRLEGDPGNIEGWEMLMRSRVTLGQPEKASQALKDAIVANPDKASELRELAQGLGIR